METKSGSRWKKVGRRPGGWLAFGGGGGGLALVAVIVAMAPIASAAPVRFGAPFTSGTPVRTLTTAVFGSGATFSVVSAPAFSMATGLATESLMATAVAGGMHQPNLARIAGTVGIDGVAYTPTSTAPFAVAAHWTLALQGKLSTASPLKGFPGGLASISVKASTYLTETATGKIVPGSTVTLTAFQKTVTSGVTALGLGPLPVVVRTPAVLLQGGSAYYITAVLTVELVVSTPGSVAGTTVLAQVTLATPNALVYLQVS